MSGDEKVTETLNVLGTEYEIVDADLGDDEGELRGHSAKIRIHQSIVKPKKRRSVLRHEAGHAVWLELGLGQSLAETMGLPPAMIARIEEAVMCTFVPAYVDTLERNRFLVAPPEEESK